MLVVAGYRFSREKVVGMKTRWQCSVRSRTKCKAFLTTIEGKLVKSHLQHNHGDNNNILILNDHSVDET